MPDEFENDTDALEIQGEDDSDYTQEDLFEDDSEGDDGDDHDDENEGHDDDDDGEERQFSAAYVKKLRRESAKLRRSNRETIAQERERAAQEARDDFARDIMSAFGLDDEDDVDPDELISMANSRADEAAKRLRAYEVKDALSSAARTYDGDVDLLIPYLRGTGALEDLDPEDDDFADQVSDVVESAIDKNPKLRLAPQTGTARRSGGDMSGGNNATKRKTPQTIDEIRAARRERRKTKFGLL